MAIVPVEQYFAFARERVDDYIVTDRGSSVLDGTSASRGDYELAASMSVRSKDSL